MIEQASLDSKQPDAVLVDEIVFWILWLHNKVGNYQPGDSLFRWDLYFWIRNKVGGLQTNVSWIGIDLSE